MTGVQTCALPISLFRHSAKNFWIFLKKILCRVPRRGTRQRNFFLKKLCRVPCPWHSTKTPRIANLFTFHCNRQYIYIYILFCYNTPGCILYIECTQTGGRTNLEQPARPSEYMHAWKFLLVRIFETNFLLNRNLD